MEKIIENSYHSILSVCKEEGKTFIWHDLYGSNSSRDLQLSLNNW